MGFNDELFDRYNEMLKADISIAMRVKKEDLQSCSKMLKLSSEKYEVIECPNISSLKGFFLNKKKCKKMIEKNINKYDMFIVRLPSMIGNTAIEVAKKNNIPYLIELVGCPWDALWNHSFKGKIMAPYMYLVTKKKVKEAKYVLYVTNKFLQKRYPTNGKSIGCSDVKIKVHNFVKEKDFHDKKMILGTLGIIDVKYKGQEYVIKALALLKKKGYNFLYQIAGPGDKTRLEKIAKKYGVLENIEFLGALSHEKVFDWLSNVDIYIQPSTTEGMPRALIEAMSIGCLCMGSNVGGIPELLDKKMIFRKKKHKDIYNIIKTLSKNDFHEQYLKNIELSEKFTQSYLDEKRKSFYVEFKKEEEKHGKTIW